MKSREIKFFSSTPLGSNEACKFRDNFYMSTDYKEITGKVFTDQDGTFQILESDNGNEWDVTYETNVKANETLVYAQKLVAEYVKLKYINGSSPQTVFRASGYLDKL